MGVNMNLRKITKNHEADREIGFLTKSISKPYGRATAMPLAWELKWKNVGSLRVKFKPKGYFNNFS